MTTTDLEFYRNLKDDAMQERLKTATNPESRCEFIVEIGKDKCLCFWANPSPFFVL